MKTIKLAGEALKIAKDIEQTKSNFFKQVEELKRLHEKTIEALRVKVNQELSHQQQWLLDNCELEVDDRLSTYQLDTRYLADHGLAFLVPMEISEDEEQEEVIH